MYQARFVSFAVGMSGMLALLSSGDLAHAQLDGFTRDFHVEERDFTAVGRNPYFILEAGYKLILAGEEDGESILVTITVLDEFEIVAGVQTRVVEEREWVDGVLAEVSRNFFAICRRTNGVFYFGEDVDIYDEQGNVVSHEGAWRAGVDGAKPGLMMPGIALLGSRYYQEVAPDVAMDRAENLSLTETVSTPAGTFENCLKVEETTPLEPDVKEYKLYARGIGLVQDEQLLLTEYEIPSPVQSWELMR